METQILETREGCGVAAADKAAELLKKAIAAKGHTCFIAATGAS